MIVKAMRRGSLCVTAHPDGCAERISQDIRYVLDRPGFGCAGPSSALVIGGSSGLGLAARISLAFGAGADTVNVCKETEGTPRHTGSAGWYNTAALESALARVGHYGRTVLGDAFSDEVKHRTAELIRAELGQVDLVVYSLAAPTRRHPDTGTVHRSALKSVGMPFTSKAWHPDTGDVRYATVEPATVDEIDDTVAVMGGDDWRRWIRLLASSGALAADATTVAFSYVGNESLAPTYRAGTLGAAKDHLEATARAMHATLGVGGGRSVVAVMRAMVTQASQVIPAQTLYTVLLGRVMRERGMQEGPIEQAHRLFTQHLYSGDRLATDAQGRIRLDDLELRPDVQSEVERRLAAVNTANLAELGDPDSYLAETLAICGFGLAGVDYTAETDPVRDIPGIVRVAGRPQVMAVH